MLPTRHQHLCLLAPGQQQQHRHLKLQQPRPRQKAAHQPARAADQQVSTYNREMQECAF